MKKQIIYVVVASALLSSCNIYKSYKRPDDIKIDGLFRDTASVSLTGGYGETDGDTATIASLPWREVFTDPQLQILIEQGLASNTDLQNAQLSVKQAEASLMSSKLAFLPSFALAPQGTISSFDQSKASQTYQLPITASWQIDLFGDLLNAKRGAKASLLQSKAYKQAVQTQLVAAIANYYYTLLMLDEQLAITQETAVKWEENVATMKAMKDAAMTNEAAVTQSEATYYSVLASIPELKQTIRETENNLCVLLGQAPQAISRGTLASQQMPAYVSAGVPLQLLANRPDVKAAEMALATAYYATNRARSAFYPLVNITGSLGWTNSAGGAIVNPGKLLASVVGSITQPLFQRGSLIAQLKITKAQQEQAKLSFQQALLNAGNEVSNALFQYQTNLEKETIRRQQVEALEKSVDFTTDLFKSGTEGTSYLEIITAEQSLLSARLSEVSDTFSKIQAVVNLYQAVGGGQEPETDENQ